MPYFALNCGPETDENTLVAGIYPNSKKKTEDTMKFPSLQEFVTDPIQVLEEIAQTKRRMTKSEALENC